MATITYTFDNDADANKAAETIGQELGQGGYGNFTGRVEIYDVSNPQRACEICEACGGRRS